MSGLSEVEIRDKHIQSLKEGKDACVWLAKNADPEWLAPRGRHYKNLRDALKALEGTCRQMSHWREDTRWLKLGILYAKAMRTSQSMFTKQNWLGFRELTQLFDNGLRRMEELDTAKTGRTGVILPKRTDWLILPDSRGAPGTPRGTMH